MNMSTNYIEKKRKLRSSLLHIRMVKLIVRAQGGVNLTVFGRDLKPGVKVTLDLLKQGINCWDCCIYFILPENKRYLAPTLAVN